MAGELATRNLYEAAINGDRPRFVELLVADPHLIDVASFPHSRNILHIATLHEQPSIVAEATTRNPELARSLDSQKSSPLHIAAAKGYVAIASRLLLVAPEMCWWRDDQGMNPVHVAALNGHVEMLRLLVGADRFPAKEKVDRGQNVLHLCLKHRRLEALRYLVESLNELVNVEDDNGEILLHAAVRAKQVEVVEYLVANHETYELPTNSKGKSVHQISLESPRDEASIQIDGILSQRISYLGGHVGFLGRMSDVTMVVVVLIATMAFQAIVSQAGGVWQDDSSSPPRRAGHAVMASTRPELFRSFMQANAVAFASSLVTIILLTTGLPSGSVIFTMAAVCTTWVSVACIMISFVASVIAISPSLETQSITHVIHVIVAMFLLIYALYCFSSRAAIRSRIAAYRMARRWRATRP